MTGILQFVKIIGARLRFSGQIDPNDPSHNYVNVDLIHGPNSVRTVNDGPFCSFGRDESHLPDPNKAGKDMVEGFRGRKIGFTGGFVKDDTVIVQVPDDLEWDIKIGVEPNSGSSADANGGR